jgi:hypothetical protein
MDITKMEEWEGEPLYNMLSEDEKAFADSLLKLTEELGPLDQSEGIWIGYKDGANNEDASIGVKCGNCALHNLLLHVQLLLNKLKKKASADLP